MPEKPDPKKEFYDLAKSFVGAATCEVFLALGHTVGTHLPLLAALVLTWLSAHVTLKIF